MVRGEELKGWCDGCNKCKGELIGFYCRVCKSDLNYCKTCLSVATKRNKCIDCYEEEG